MGPDCSSSPLKRPSAGGQIFEFRRDGRRRCRASSRAIGAVQSLQGKARAVPVLCCMKPQDQFDLSYKGIQRCSEDKKIEFPLFRSNLGVFLKFFIQLIEVH